MRSATVDVSGTTAATLGAATRTATGIVDVGSTTGAQVGALVTAADGMVDVVGRFDAVLGPATRTADGTVTAFGDINGTTAAQLAAHVFTPTRKLTPAHPTQKLRAKWL